MVGTVAFGTASMDLADWGACVALASAVLWYDEIRKIVLRGLGRRHISMAAF